MIFNLEDKDIHALAQRMLELILPHLERKEGTHGYEELLDAQRVARYLQVSKKWVYERVHFNEIPFVKIGGCLRFRKGAIDKWLEEFEVPAVVNTYKKPGGGATL